MTARGDDSGVPATTPSHRRRRGALEPADHHHVPGEPAGRPAQGLSERALAHARQAAAQAPPLPPGAVERLRQIIYGASPAATERKAS
jgi:hypothetical protein